MRCAAPDGYTVRVCGACVGVSYHTVRYRMILVLPFMIRYYYNTRVDFIMYGPDGGRVLGFYQGPFRDRVLVGQPPAPLQRLVTLWNVVPT